MVADRTPIYGDDIDARWPLWSEERKDALRKFYAEQAAKRASDFPPPKTVRIVDHRPTKTDFCIAAAAVGVLAAMFGLSWLLGGFP